MAPGLKPTARDGFLSPGSQARIQSQAQHVVVHRAGLWRGKWLVLLQTRESVARHCPHCLVWLSGLINKRSETAQAQALVFVLLCWP